MSSRIFLASLLHKINLIWKKYCLIWKQYYLIYMYATLSYMEAIIPDMETICFSITYLTRKRYRLISHNTTLHNNARYDI